MADSRRKFESSVSKRVIGEDWEILTLGQIEQEVIRFGTGRRLSDLARLFHLIQRFRIIHLVSQPGVGNHDGSESERDKLIAGSSNIVNTT